MFLDIPDEILFQMKYLEEIDARDRKDGTARLDRLRQVPPETGRFISLIATISPSGKWIEIGTSAGYSALWLSLACKERKQKLYTFELLDNKIRMAEDTFRKAKVEKYIELIKGDALNLIENFSDISFCFLDAEKEIYFDCYEKVIPRLVRGGILIADNAINHKDTLQPMLDRALSDPRIDSLIVPIGKGELLCRKL